jgi:hypothetical protein
VRTAFVGPVDDVESIGKFKIKQHREEEDGDEEGVDEKTVQKNAVFMNIV